MIYTRLVSENLISLDLIQINRYPEYNALKDYHGFKYLQILLTIKCTL